MARGVSSGTTHERPTQQASQAQLEMPSGIEYSSGIDYHQQINRTAQFFGMGGRVMSGKTLPPVSAKTQPATLQQ